MIRYNKKGMMVFPCPDLDEDDENILVVESCYCPEVHNLVTANANFNGFNGIIMKIENEDKTDSGLIAMSPICGDQSKITLDIELKEDELYSLYCPECNTKLPVYSNCTCGGSLIALFLTPEKDFTDCICVCNRNGCHKSFVKKTEESFSIRKMQTRWK